MAIFTTLSVVIWFSTGTLGIFATLLSSYYLFTMRVVIYDILSMAIITTPGGNISQNFSEIIFDFLIFQFSEKFWEIF